MTLRWVRRPGLLEQSTDRHGLIHMRPLVQVNELPAPERCHYPPRKHPFHLCRAQSAYAITMGPNALVQPDKLLLEMQEVRHLTTIIITTAMRIQVHTVTRMSCSLCNYWPISASTHTSGKLSTSSVHHSIPQLCSFTVPLKTNGQSHKLAPAAANKWR